MEDLIKIKSKDINMFGRYGGYGGFARKVENDQGVKCRGNFKTAKNPPKSSNPPNGGCGVFVLGRDFWERRFDQGVIGKNDRFCQVASSQPDEPCSLGR